ncbi:MAG: molybdopterin-guanine dinucleotide biosynthesis protein B [Pseudomonadota bacterium]|jgi:molybdopterin-guanine dinucleotide biosynthesis protein B|nr:molybdopterin-guanine dinucleotide biosynthesis protein B [Pseudomonadota bacterium]MEC8136879.1 molybdopterin-guanine dinucleotide biosynthesis protein B [Pseudomonadota bacterium]MEC8697765.1 molybdopterin-guanine dinucleotide biosynthesis protein B [Pseudomonadota bacterium]
MKIFGLAGWSGSGKTTLLVGLIPELTQLGLTVSTIKHAHHRFDIDTPGKDSYEHRRAGATEVMVTSVDRWALMHENRGEGEPDVDTLISRMSPVDLLLIEGFKSYPHDKLEVHRPSIGKPLLANDDESIVAIASDAALTNIRCPVLDLGDFSMIAAFIASHCGLGETAKDGATE